MILFDPWIVVSRVTLEEGPYFRTVLARRYQGSEVIEVRRVIPIDPPRPKGFFARVRDRWREWQERRAIDRGNQPFSVYDRLKQLQRRTARRRERG